MPISEELRLLQHLGRETRLWESCIYDSNFSSYSDCSGLITEIKARLQNDYKYVSIGRLVGCCFLKAAESSGLTFHQRMLIACLYYDDRFDGLFDLLGNSNVEAVKQSLKDKTFTSEPIRPFHMSMSASERNAEIEDKKRYHFSLLYGYAYFLGDKDAAYALARVMVTPDELPQHIVGELWLNQESIIILNTLQEQNHLDAILMIADIKGGLVSHPEMVADTEGAIRLLEFAARDYENDPQNTRLFLSRLGVIYQRWAEELEKCGGREKEASNYFSKAQTYLEPREDARACYIQGSNLFHRRVSLSPRGKKDKKVHQIHVTHQSEEDKIDDRQAINLFNEAILMQAQKAPDFYALSSFRVLGQMVLEGRHPEYSSENPLKAMEFYEQAREYKFLAKVYERGWVGFPKNAENKIDPDKMRAAFYYRMHFESIAEKIKVFSTIIDEVPKPKSRFFSFSDLKKTANSQRGISHLVLYSTKEQRELADLHLVQQGAMNDSTEVLSAKLRAGLLLYGKYEGKGEFRYKGNEDLKKFALYLIYFAAQHNLVSAMYELAKIDYQENRHESAVAWMHAAAKQGHPWAHYTLYQFYTGELPNTFLERNQENALKHIKAAALSESFVYISLPKRNPAQEFRSKSNIVGLDYSKASTAQKYEHPYSSASL